ncbi:MAG: hypothetical protein J6Q72_01810 [Clostridia bacterium]|nr:hypothetical protein [Clostridia bacterium]
MKKRKIILNALLFIALACVTAFAVWGYIDVRRESEYIAAQPGSSGMDFLGPSILAGAVVIITYMLAALAVDIYISLRYFLVSAVRRRVKTVMNAVALFLSAISLLLFVFIGILDAGIDNGLFLFGFLWACVLPIYRLIYLCICIGNGLHNEQEETE